MGKKLYTNDPNSEAYKKGDRYFLFDCPGCDMLHMYCTGHAPGDNGPCWDFNGNLESPTFKPSLLYNVNRSNPTVPLCHLYMTDGKIQFLSDCTHSLAGKTVEMKDIE